MADPEVYFPGNVPNEPENLPRYLDDELHRIATAIPVPYLNYTILHDTTLLVPLTATPIFGRLFDDPPIDSEVDIPDTQFNQTTGVWTCVAGGIYDISCTLGGTAPGAGNKQWAIELNTTVAGSTRDSTTAGQDNFDLTVSDRYVLPLSIGDTVFFDASAVTDTPGGATSDFDAYAQIWRLA